MQAEVIRLHTLEAFETQIALLQNLDKTVEYTGGEIEFPYGNHL